MAHAEIWWHMRKYGGLQVNIVSVHVPYVSFMFYAMSDRTGCQILQYTSVYVDRNMELDNTFNLGRGRDNNGKVTFLDDINNKHQVGSGGLQENKTGTRQGQDMDKTRTRQGQDRDKTKQGQDRDKMPTTPGKDRDKTGTRQGQDRDSIKTETRQ